MNMKRWLLIVTFAVLPMLGTTLRANAVPDPVGATLVPLVAITNDRDTSISEIELLLGPHELVRGLRIATYEKGDDPDQAREQLVPLAALESAQGAVVGQGQGVKAILLRGDIHPNEGTGALVIRYLTNGVFGKYKECRVNLRRTGPSQWDLVNAYTHGSVGHIHVKTWALGISTLENVCPTGHT